MAEVRRTTFCRFRAQLMLGCAASLCVVPARADVQLQSASPAKISWTAVGDGLFCAPLDIAPDTGGALALNVCPQREASRGVKFDYSGVPAAFGVFDLRAGMAEQTTTEALTIEQLVDANAFTQRNVALNVGATSRLFDNRLTLSSDFAWSRDEIRFGDAAFATDERLGSGRWYKADLVLVDDKPVRWTAAVELSSVDRDYAANFNARPNGAVMLPGDRVAASTTMKLPDVTVTLSGDRTDGPYGERASERARAAFDGLVAVVAAKRSAYAFTYGGVTFANTSEAATLSLEVTPDVLVPSLAEDALIPANLTLTLSRGTFASGAEPGTRASLEVLADWTGRWGDTSASYWRETKTLAAGESVAQMLDVSHTVRWGDWRVGAGAFVTDNGSAGTGDLSVMGSLTVAYEVKDGPQLRVRVGHERDNSEDEGFAFRRVASDIMFSLDLSPYARKELGRPEAHLTVDFRKTLDHSVETIAFDDWPDEQSVRKAYAEGLLVSFGTRF